MSSELPQTLVNGESQSTLLVSDRGLAYGHGVFESIRICHGQPVLWQQHMQRLLQSCVRLGITVPERLDTLLKGDVTRLCNSECDGVIKIIITAGSGGRGYACAELTDTQRIVSLFPLPSYPVDHVRLGVKIITCDYRLPHNARLAGMKHLNRLDQVLARSEWRNPDIAEGILLDFEDKVVEGTMSNLFAVKQGKLLTPSLEHAGIKGVMRSFVIEVARSMGLETHEVRLTVDEFKLMDEVFLTNSVIGLWPVRQWDQQPYSRGDTTDVLQQRIERLSNEKASERN